MTASWVEQLRRYILPPACRLYVFEDEDVLYNPRLKRTYAIRDDIPVMLIDEAEKP